MVENQLRFRLQMVPIGTIQPVDRWLRLSHQMYDGTELKNIMERFIQYIKDRTECLDDHFPCRKPDCNMQYIWNWLKLFVLYVHMDMDRTRFVTFLVMNLG